MNTNFQGFLRSDGRKGIRNIVVVAYLVECAHFVARHVVQTVGDPDVHLIGFPGCYPNAYAERMMERLLTHPNVGGVLLVSLGCESFNKNALQEIVAVTGRPVNTLTIQQAGGTRKTVDAGVVWVEECLRQVKKAEKVPMGIDELVIGTICGGSDGTSGITANPSVGLAYDHLISQGITGIFEETGELIGCEDHMAKRAATPELGKIIVAAVEKARKYYEVLGHGSFAIGNALGGLTTQEEKSLGAYSKSGNSTIVGLIKPGDLPTSPGMYLLDVVPDGEVRFGFPNISDNAEIVELMACGAHINLFTTGMGSVVGSAISPVIKICANPSTYKLLADDMDVNAGKILEGTANLDDIAHEIITKVFEVVQGLPSKSEALGHQEFILGYKSFEPIGPACLPVHR